MHRPDHVNQYNHNVLPDPAHNLYNDAASQSQAAVFSPLHNQENPAATIHHQHRKSPVRQPEVFHPLLSLPLP